MRWWLHNFPGCLCLKNHGLEAKGALTAVIEVNVFFKIEIGKLTD